MTQPERHEESAGHDAGDFDIFDFESPEAEEAAWQEAQADIAAGRVVPHEDVAKWLMTWGTDTETPMPEEWLK